VTDTQILKVVPMVNLGVDVTTTEGNTLSIDVLLSGQAADYPVSVPFTVSGTAAEGDDYTVGSTGSVIITEGTMASISLSIVADEAAESEENVVITLGEATNAVLGVNTDQVITIVEGNLPPKVTLQISQAGIAGSTIAQNLGVAMINVAIFDANATDTHTVDWAKTLLTLPNATVGVKALEFDAAALAVGVYLVEVDISDGVEIVSVAVNLNVLAQAPVLSADADSDGDGISDADEGYGDSDGDGIPDYLDNIAEPNLIPFGDSGAVVESEPGTQMILGGFALGAGGNNVGISEEYIAALTGIADNSFDYPGGLIDFILTGAEPGYSYTLVVPLSVAIPESAVYRKYSASGGWADFVFSGTNALSTAMSVEGACPALGSDLYTLDLTAGDDCLQMFIADGGANDADGVANGSLFDPGGIAVRDIGIPSSNSQVVLSNTTLKANGTDSTTVTVTALSAEGVGLEFMNVTGSMALVGVVVSDFVEQGSGIYTATVTAGMTSGNGPVTVVIDNGDTSITVSSERLQITAIEKSSSGGGGCTVASNGSSDASLLVLLVLAGLLLARRRYLVR
jgi:MYXO-CTERM domain-containing protein